MSRLFAQEDVFSVDYIVDYINAEDKTRKEEQKLVRQSINKSSHKQKHYHTKKVEEAKKRILDINPLISFMDFIPFCEHKLKVDYLHLLAILSLNFLLFL